MSFRRAADENMDNNSGIKRKVSVRVRMILERKKPQQEAIENVGPADRVAHDALSIHSQFELSEAGGGHAVGRIDIGWADHATHSDDLVLGIDQNILRSFYHQ